MNRVVAQSWLVRFGRHDTDGGLNRASRQVNREAWSSLADYSRERAISADDATPAEGLLSGSKPTSERPPWCPLEQLQMAETGPMANAPSRPASATPGSQKRTLHAMRADLVGIYRRCILRLAIARNSSKRALHPDRTHVATVLDSVLGKRPDFGEPHLPMQTYRGFVR
jgi:hypothetical protein